MPEFPVQIEGHWENHAILPCDLCKRATNQLKEKSGNWVCEECHNGIPPRWWYMDNPAAAHWRAVTRVKWCLVHLGRGFNEHLVGSRPKSCVVCESHPFGHGEVADTHGVMIGSESAFFEPVIWDPGSPRPIVGGSR